MIRERENAEIQPTSMPLSTPSPLTNTPSLCQRKIDPENISDISVRQPCPSSDERQTINNVTAAGLLMARRSFPSANRHALPDVKQNTLVWGRGRLDQ